MRGDVEDTVRLPPRRRGVPLKALLAIGGALVLLVAASLWAFGPATGGGETVRFADEQTIDANDPVSLTVFRFRPRPSIVVLDFPTLAEQGRMLDRIAALVEKDKLPHDRVLDDDALAAAIRADGDEPDTWYYGHDYRATDIARFFRLAVSDGVRLNADEEHLRRLVARLRQQPDGFGAVITLPRANPATGVDPAARAIILHHELSHGDYFTDPGYVRAVTATWRDVLTPDERAKVRAYLKDEEYDPSLTDLMQNEMQAYIVYTPPGRFCSPAKLGIAPDRLDVIRDSLRLAGPRWLVPAASWGFAPNPTKG